MQKSPLRRLRLEHFQVGDIDIPAKVAENGDVENINGTQQALPVVAEEPAHVLLTDPDDKLPAGELEAPPPSQAYPWQLPAQSGLWAMVFYFVVLSDGHHHAQTRSRSIWSVRGGDGRL